MTRKEFYEELVSNLSESEFIRLFGCRPHDIMDFDYSFDNVEWNMALEYAYNDYIDNI